MGQEADNSNTPTPNKDNTFDQKQQGDTDQAISRARYNAANEKLIEDQLHISEDKLFDYTPGKD
jgi:hypothetical protein